MTISRAQMGSQLKGTKMAKTRKRQDVRTSQMPDGSQQYTRGATGLGRMDTAHFAARAADRRGDSEAGIRLHDAFLAEADRTRNARRNEYQTTDEDRANRRKSGGQMKSKKMAKGGKVRGDGVCQRGKTKGRMV